MRNKILSILFVFSALFTSCNDRPTCIPEQTNLLKIAFVNIIGGPKEITFVSITVDNSNANFPSITDTTHTNFIIPLNPIDSSIIIRFKQDTIDNYMAFSYSATPIVLNPACAIETKFDFLKMDSTDFENSLLIEPAISLQTIKNIEITH